MIWLIGSIAVVLSAIKFYYWATLNNDYFEKHGIKYVKPQFFLGSTGKLFLKKYAPNVFYTQMYNEFPNERLFGIFDFRQPLFIFRDPELIRQIAIKDFDHFSDHQNCTGEIGENMFSSTLFLLKEDKWRAMRATLSPAFTGSKMRHMFTLVTKCALDMSNYVKKETVAGRPLNDDIKDLFSKYSTDVIATSAFGIEVNSFENPNNEFYLLGKNLLKFDIFIAIRLIVMRLMPLLAKLLEIEILNRKIVKFFKTMVLKNINNRIENGIYRPDMINILKEIVEQGRVQWTSEESSEIEDGFSAAVEYDIGSKAISKLKWNNIELVAQCFQFFVAGFETISTVLTFAAYELAINQDIQDRLYAEILDTANRLGDRSIDYEDLQKMKYMDMFVSEVLRLWPPLMHIDRLCVKDYTVEVDNKKTIIEKETTVWIPVYALHHDPKYYNNPEKCDPDRFSEENKRNILPGTYLPFGIGPRNCIGSRFALMEIKAVLYSMILNFKFEPNADTQIPLKLAKHLQVKSENGVKLTFLPR